MWTIKHKPKNLKEFINQNQAVDTFLKWIKKWEQGESLLFHGPPGTGKTSLLEAYAKENNLELIQMNASDFRSASQIQEVLGQSMLQASLFKKSKIFLIDEIDGLAGREDTGGSGEIIKIIKESKFPIVLTANNPYDPKLRALRQHCELVQFKKMNIVSIEKRLNEICELEKIKADNEVLKGISARAEGDLRAAINDLENLSQGKNKIALEDLESLDYRERETSIFDSMKIIFKTKTVLTAKQAINNVDKDPDEIFWWIENNITNEYEDPKEIAQAFDVLSRADLFRSQVSSTQDWRLKGYMIDMMTAGIAVSKKEMYRKFTRYQYPQNIIFLGSSKQDRKEMKELLGKLSKQFHCSSKKLKMHYLPFFRIMLKDKKLNKNFMSSFNLNEDEMEVLK